MPSTYSNLKIELIPTGAQSGVWGVTTNANLGTAIEQAIVGMATSVTADFTSNVATYTLIDTNASQTARAFCLNVTATLTGAGTINVPAIQKPYLVFNNSVGGFAVTVKVSGQTGVSIPNGKKAWLYNNGTDVGVAFDYAPSLSLSTPLPVLSGGTGQTSLSAVTVGTATNVAGGAANRVVFQSGASTTSFVTAPVTIGTVLGWTGAAFDWVAAPASSTATNLAGGAAGDIVYQSAVSTSAFLPDVAIGNALITGGVGVAPSYGKIGLTTHVSGTLPVANGGTGANTLTANNVILGNGTSSPLFVAPGTSGNLLTSNGTTWASTAPAPSVSAIELFYYANANA